MNTQKEYTQINNLGKFWENFIIVAIIFVLIVTFLDEYAIIAEWSLTSRKYLAASSFFFDLVFSIEFIARIVKTSRFKAASHYFLYERGWVDLVSSLPLLLLNSGPEFFIQFFPDYFDIHGTGIGFFSTMKVVKAIRITRILRFLRMIKFLGKIQNANSHMANRHIAVISTITVMTVIVVFAFASMSGFLGFQSLEKQKVNYYHQLFSNFETMHKTDSENMEETLGKLFYQTGTEESEILQVYYKNQLVLSQMSIEKIENIFTYNPNNPPEKRFNDIHTHKITAGKFIVFLNLYPMYQEKARIHIFIFIAIVFIIFAMMTLYTRHFVQTVSDPIHVMYKGFREPEFHLEVKKMESYGEDEIFNLASEYNEKWLPAKMQNKEDESKTSTGGLTLDDFLG